MSVGQSSRISGEPHNPSLQDGGPSVSSRLGPLLPPVGLGTGNVKDYKGQKRKLPPVLSIVRVETNSNRTRYENLKKAARKKGGEHERHYAQQDLLNRLRLWKRHHPGNFEVLIRGKSREVDHYLMLSPDQAAVEKAHGLQRELKLLQRQ
ncbi:hypothetical protein ACFE04_026732 [Oxalis oulophora]